MSEPDVPSLDALVAGITPENRPGEIVTGSTALAAENAALRAQLSAAGERIDELEAALDGLKGVGVAGTSSSNCPRTAGRTFSAPEYGAARA